MSEKLRVRWTDHEPHFKISLADILDKQRLCDVTITSEGKIFKAHQIILSMCSPYFEKIFRDLPKNNHPVIFFKDISAMEIEFLLSYVYKGEVIVPKNMMASFLNTCENLQIEGIFENNTHLNPSNCDKHTNNNLSTDIYYSVPSTEENNDNTKDIICSVNNIIQDIEKSPAADKIAELSNMGSPNLPVIHSVESIDKDATNDFVQNSSHEKPGTSEDSFVFSVNEDNNQNVEESSSQVMILVEPPVEVVVLSDESNCSVDNRATNNIKDLNSINKENNIKYEEIDRLSTIIDVNDYPSDAGRIDDIEGFVDIQPIVSAEYSSDDSEVINPVLSRINRFISCTDNMVDKFDNKGPGNNDSGHSQCLDALKFDALEKGNKMVILLEKSQSIKKTRQCVDPQDLPQAKRSCHNVQSESSTDDEFKLIIEDDSDENVVRSTNGNSRVESENRGKSNSQNEILVRTDPVNKYNFNESDNDEYISKVFNSPMDIPKHLLKLYCVQCKRCIQERYFKKHIHGHSLEFGNRKKKGRKSKKQPKTIVE